MSRSVKVGPIFHFPFVIFHLPFDIWHLSDSLQ